jgi:hypothetical protein
LLPPLPPLREGGREGRNRPRQSEKTFNLRFYIPAKMVLELTTRPSAPGPHGGARAGPHLRILIAPPLPRIERGAGESITTPIAKPSDDASPDSRGQARGQAGGELSRPPMGGLCRDVIEKLGIYSIFRSVSISRR